MILWEGMSLSVSPKMVVTTASTWSRAAEAHIPHGQQAQLNGVKDQLGDQVVVGGSAFQETSKSRLMSFLGKVGKAAAPALVGAGLAVATAGAGAIIAIPGLAIAAGAATIGGMSVFEQAKFIKTEWNDYKASRELNEAHQGLTVWSSDLDGNIPVEKNSSSADGLREMLIANMKAYPTSTHVVHLSGHGRGALYSAGMPGEDLAEAFVSATEQTGRKVDVAVLDSCYGANFEQLHRYGDSVGYILATEDPSPGPDNIGGGLPLSEMLLQASASVDAREAALSMSKVRNAHLDQANPGVVSHIPQRERLKGMNKYLLGLGTDATAVAIDTSALRKGLHPALDSLGAVLLEGLKANPELKAHLQACRENSVLDDINDQMDLGNFLELAKKGINEDSPAHRALVGAQEQLELTVFGKRTSAGQPLGGLSVHTRDKMLDSLETGGGVSRPLADSALPQNWVKFVRKVFN